MTIFQTGNVHSANCKEKADNQQNKQWDKVQICHLI